MYILKKNKYYSLITKKHLLRQQITYRHLQTSSLQYDP